nr:MAG TPA: hypothetical protein [Caudoviricetes sp.]
MNISNPDNLSDTQWAMSVKELEWLRQKEKEQ